MSTMNKEGVYLTPDQAAQMRLAFLLAREKLTAKELTNVTEEEVKDHIKISLETLTTKIIH